MNKRWIVHFVASCVDCGWHTEDYSKRATKAAYAHAKSKKHTLRGEIGFAFEYKFGDKK